MAIKGLPKMQGGLVRGEREYGSVYQCLQCGHEVAAEKATDVQRLVSIVARHFGVKTKDILGRARTDQIALARQVVMYLLVEDNDWMLKQVGYKLGRTPSTVHAGCRSIIGKIRTYSKMAGIIESIREEMGTKIGGNDAK